MSNRIVLTSEGEKIAIKVKEIYKSKDNMFEANMEEARINDEITVSLIKDYLHENANNEVASLVEIVDRFSDPTSKLNDVCSWLKSRGIDVYGGD